MHDPLQESSETFNIAHAIAIAEGFGKANTIPTTRHNPGDLTNFLGQKILFDTDDDGWSALYRQVNLMISGRSRYYKPTMTWEEIGKIYDGEAEYMNWVNNVCDSLQVETTSTINDYIAGIRKVQINVAVADSVNLGDKIS